MLTYKIVSQNNGISQYEYYPEGDVTSPGIVEFTIGKEPKMIKQSAKDFKMMFGIHALQGIDTSKTSGTIAWC